MRTSDTSYGADYWQSFDGGAGYTDSPMWEDLAFSVKEVYGIRDGKDISGSVHHLDVGCAYGFLVRHLRRRGFDSWGCDVSAHAISNAPSDTRPYVFVRDVVASAIPDYSTVGFNLITCYETMEHIPEEDVYLVLRTIYERLESGGQALFTICLEDRPGWDSDPTHVTIKSRAWWDERLKLSGFVADEARYEHIRRFYLYSDHNGIFALGKP